MSDRPAISFARLAAPKKGSVVVLAAEGGGLSAAAKACDPANVLAKAFPLVGFTGKLAKTADIIAPEGHGYDRIVAIGVGKPTELNEQAWMKIGGVALTQNKRATDVSVVLDLDGIEMGRRLSRPWR